MKPYLRGSTWWIGFVDAGGRWHYKSAKTAHLKEAEETLAEIEEAVAQGKAVAAAPQTFAAYAIAWCTERGARRDDEKVWTADGELRQLKMHAFPVLGGMRLDAIRSSHIRAFVKMLKATKARARRGKKLVETGELLAARSVRNIYAIVSTLFDDAVADGLLDASPCVLKSGDMPAIADKDPEWRDDAEYTRAEVEQLISDERIPWNRRVWWALGFLTGMRSGEVAALRWRHLVAETPLQMLRVVGSYNPKHRRVKSTKTKRPRRVPVHPLLAAILAEWKLTGWRELAGKAPGADDLLVPNEKGTYLSDWCTKKTRPRDLRALGLRVRRFHDARATFIGLGTADGGDEVWLERVTHNAKGNTFNQYRRANWLKMCEAVSCLRVQRRGVAQARELRSAGGLLQPVLQEAAMAKEDDEIAGKGTARPAGLEPTDSDGSRPRATANADGSSAANTSRDHQNGEECRNVGKTPEMARRARLLLAKYAAGGR